MIYHTRVQSWAIKHNFDLKIFTYNNHDNPYAYCHGYVLNPIFDGQIVKALHEC
jgi:hypothetical protein